MFPNTPHVEAVARFVRDPTRVAEVRAAADAAASADRDTRPAGPPPLSDQ
jgi:hypothetical protein